MKNTLLVNASVNGEASYSKKLAAAIVDKISGLYPGGEIRTVDLAETPYPHITGEFVATYWKNPTDRTEAEHRLMALSDKATEDLLWADNLVIGFPLTNYSVPSNLKAWIEHIVRPGLTFSFSAEGQGKGLAKGKKVYLAMSSGGIFSTGPVAHMDKSDPYLRLILDFMGMADITTIRVEGVNRSEHRESALEKAIASIDEVIGVEPVFAEAAG